jgi:hypothetical protein
LGVSSPSDNLQDREAATFAAPEPVLPESVTRAVVMA